MEQHEHDVQPLGGPDAKRCAECSRVLVGRRADATWCTARCRMRWKRKQRRLDEARASYSAVRPDVSLAELHERARPRLDQADEDLVEPGEVVPDEFGYTDGLLDDNHDTANASWTVRQQIEAERTAIRARYADDLQYWQDVYRRNPGPAPKLDEINRRMRAEIEAIERAYYQAEAYGLAAADHLSGRAQARAAERQTAMRNMQDFGRDLRGAGYEPVEVSKATSDVFQFGEPSSVFGSDTELFRKSGIAQKMHNSDPYTTDGFVY